VRRLPISVSIRFQKQKGGMTARWESENLKMTPKRGGFSVHRHGSFVCPFVVQFGHRKLLRENRSTKVVAIVVAFDSSGWCDDKDCTKQLADSRVRQTETRATVC
jgi:hypothetical protein